MPDAGRIICIAGAGIAGMTLALTLAKFGARIFLIEREPAIQEFGAGLQISPNARRVLSRLGLDRAIHEVSFEPAGIDVYAAQREKHLITLRLGDEAERRFGAPYAVMHRQDLAEVLHRACKRFANIDFMFGARSFSAEETGKGVSVQVDEADGNTRNLRAFALIGADGVHSRTRTVLMGAPLASSTGLVAWRVLLKISDVGGLIPTDRTSLFLGRGWHLVAYPLPHRGQVNIALFLENTANAGAEPPLNPLFSRNHKLGARVEAIMTLASGHWGRWPLNNVSLPSWHKGSIGLIGDAAHAMLPFQAQGAAMGIEDAAVLAPLLMTEESADAAFSRYEDLRRARVERVTRISRSNGQIYGLGTPLAVGRDLVIRLGGPTAHLKRLDWLYRYDAAPEIATGNTQATPALGTRR